MRNLFIYPSWHPLHTKEDSKVFIYLLPLPRTNSAEDFPRTKSAEDFNPLLAKEGEWGGKAFISLPQLIENLYS